MLSAPMAFEGRARLSNEAVSSLSWTVVAASLGCVGRGGDLISLAGSCLALAVTDGMSSSETPGLRGCSQTGSGVLGCPASRERLKRCS